ncbi:iron ABC transporter substrate-binding protein [Oleidesulfovibrio sp.]|uniref:iron ABC transporter substrate-binding protein n=1 Tax=Oleidesulfovibrio sp. TaxID=2909707 RepID=UPI003A855CAF
MRKLLVLGMLVLSLTMLCSPAHAGIFPDVVDATGQPLTSSTPVTKVVCSGSGCLRLLTYIEAESLAVAVDDMEVKRAKFDTRPYALAHPEFKKLPIFGEFRGHDNPELILSLEPQPEVIFKTYTSSMGYDPKELQLKTGIPVIVLDYGDLGENRQALFHSLRVMGRVTGKSQRAEEVIAFFESAIADLHKRTAHVAPSEQQSVFVGGIAFKGPHGFQSTEPGYPPFEFVNAKNLAVQDSAGKCLKHSDVAKEKIVEWDPDCLFVDLSTLRLGDKANGVAELKSDPAYQTLNAVKAGNVHGLLPYNWYTQNFGSILANAYFVGKVLYPALFSDVNPAEKADEIYTFLVGRPVFEKLNNSFDNLAFQPVPVN